MVLRMLFVLISTAGVVSALGTVLARNLFHAALFLAGFFFAVACEFLLLEAEFLAVVQVLVYVGAVAILLLIGIMLTRNVQGDETTGGSWVGKLPAGIAAGAVLVLLLVGICNQPVNGNRPAWINMTERLTASDLGQLSPIRTEVLEKGMAEDVGRELMTRYVVPFEVAGLLLTAAVVGAIALAYPALTEDRPSSALARRSGTEPGPNGSTPGPNGSTTSSPIENAVVSSSR